MALSESIIKLKQQIEKDKSLLLDQIYLLNWEVDLKKDIYEKIMGMLAPFTEAMSNKGQSVDFYSSNRNTFKEKAIEDIKLGKFGEIATYMLLKHIGFPSTAIDLEVRHNVNKGWLCDLPFSTTDISFPDCHVKTCSDVTKQIARDYSWTFQVSNVNEPGGKDSLFKSNHEHDIIALTYIPNIKSSKVCLKALIPWKIARRCLRDPIKKDLRGIKRCLYYKDLESEIEAKENENKQPLFYIDDLFS